MKKSSSLCPQTIAAKAGIDQDAAYGAITPPLVTSSNFSFESFGNRRLYDYTRSGNPTRETLGQVIAELEGGHNAVITSSGLSALNLIFSDVRADDLIIAPHDCYGGSYRLLRERADLGQFRLKFIDLTDPATWDVAFAGKPKVVLIETPSNPLLRITDVRAVAERAHGVGALVVADNTFLSPVSQKPLELGADAVVHSLTKYINGHSDVVGGAVVAKSPELFERLAWWANVVGVTGAPFDSWLVLRGIRTLDLRVRAQTRTAGEIARYLEGHPAVAKVYYPGLASHEGHALAARQQDGFGAMLSIELTAPDKVEAFVNALAGPGKLFSLAESLGGFESLIAHPATMTHASMTDEERRHAGVSDALLRISIGLEAARDLKNALKKAFAAAGL
ncbi:cystathionine gamma-synthase [Telmatospirillum siberiense]|uniref:cystathionine gamma-synthase n=1 Tax=Telmatospirillum siberiense TaxID=382514 RepID=UPI0018EB615A|nr:cystathionine gamma-synthase [Telmatospirillum siberiense]